MNTNKKWCCHIFEEHINTTKSGFKILVVKNDKVFLFALHYFAVDEKHKNSLAARIGSFETHVVLSTTNFIKYCPWCGKNLIKFYRFHNFEISILLEKFLPKI